MQEKVITDISTKKIYTFAVLYIYYQQYFIHNILICTSTITRCQKRRKEESKKTGIKIFVICCKINISKFLSYFMSLEKLKSKITIN